MKNLLIFALFSLIFLSVGEFRDKAPPGVDVLSCAEGAEALNAVALKVESVYTCPVISGQIFATNYIQTEVATVRRYDRRLWSNVAKVLINRFEPRPKSLWLYSHLLYEAKNQESTTTNRLYAFRHGQLVFKTEYG